MHGDLEPHSAKPHEVITGVQKAISWHPWENVILQLEVPNWNQGERLHHVEIYKWCLVVAQHDDFREQAFILCSLGNHQVTPTVVLPVSFGQVHMVKQGMAGAGA